MYADTPSGQIHYRELGEGRPVLLLHKTPSSSVMWTCVMPLLAAAGFRTIAPDTRGYGSSEPPSSPPPEMGFYARAALGVLDHLGVEQADVCGFVQGDGDQYLDELIEPALCLARVQGLPFVTAGTRVARRRGSAPAARPPAAPGGSARPAAGRRRSRSRGSPALHLGERGLRLGELHPGRRPAAGE